MTTNELSGRPPIVDLDNLHEARDELLTREKAHTHEGTRFAAAGRWLPMVEGDTPCSRSVTVAVAVDPALKVFK